MGTWPFAEFAANKSNIEGNLLAMLQLALPFAERVRSATRQSRFVGTAVPNFFRKPYGPGWALVGENVARICDRRRLRVGLTCQNGPSPGAARWNTPEGSKCRSRSHSRAPAAGLKAEAVPSSWSRKFR